MCVCICRDDDNHASDQPQQTSLIIFVKNTYPALRTFFANSTQETIKTIICNWIRPF